MTENNHAIRLSFADSFMDSLQSLPPVIQSRTFEALNRFRISPVAGGRNLEKIANQMMSIRIDLAYRAILSEIESGSSYLMLWVDHHDEAYQWAERRKVVATGNVIQVIRTVEEKETVSPSKRESLFSRFSARHLRRIGVSEEQLPLVESIRSEDDLTLAASEFHPSVFEALCYLASGIPIDEIIDMIGLEENKPSDDAADFATALYSARTKQTVITLNDELDLIQVQKMLDQPLEDWRLFLHASQRKLVEAEFSGPVKVIGGAGTGKTVVAVHRVKRLAEHLLKNPDDRILLTTYTVNLASEIDRSLHKICQPSLLPRIDVINADKLVVVLFNKIFPAYRVAYGDEINLIWKQAIEQNQYVGHLSIEFFKDEWSRVVVPQQIKSLQEYMRADRTGRGTKLSRPDKAIVWSIYATYFRLVSETNTIDIDLATSMLTELLIQGQLLPQYASIVIDEAQDFNKQTLVFLRALCGPEHENDLFIVGDAHQRIYRNLVRLSHCGIETRGRSHTLRINYRTTEQIRRWAFRLFENHSVDDLDDQEENGKGNISLMSGPKPEVVQFNTQNEEIKHIIQVIHDLETDKHNHQKICLAVRTSALLNQYKQALDSEGFRVYEIKSNNFDQQSIPGIRIATMHRVKGLEFDHVILCAINEGVVPLQTALRNAADPISLKEAEDIERALLYVASTRARQTLHVFSYWRQSKFLTE